MDAAKHGCAPSDTDGVRTAARISGRMNRHRMVTSSASGAWSRPEEHWTQHRYTTELSWITILRGRFAPMQKG